MMNKNNHFSALSTQIKDSLKEFGVYSEEEFISWVIHIPDEKLIDIGFTVEQIDLIKQSGNYKEELGNRNVDRVNGYRVDSKTADVDELDSDKSHFSDNEQSLEEGG